MYYFYAEFKEHKRKRRKKKDFVSNCESSMETVSTFIIFLYAVIVGYSEQTLNSEPLEHLRFLLVASVIHLQGGV